MKPRKPLLVLAALLAATVAAVVAPTARADCVSDATVTYVGDSWGPLPVWRVSIPSLNATYDVNAADADSARAAIAGIVTCPAAPATDTTTTSTAPAATDPASTDPAADAPTNSGPSDQALADANALLADATVTYVGDSWGPVPIWRVFIPSRNSTYDVAAADAATAKQAIVNALAASIDSTPTVTTSPTATSSQAPGVAATLNGQPVAVDSTQVAPAPAVVKATPAKAKTAKRGVHSAPATAKARHS